MSVAIFISEEHFGKEAYEWLRLPDTQRYLSALAAKAKVKESHFARTTRGGAKGVAGTWLNPKLGVAFARWLDIDFSIWCDEQVDSAAESGRLGRVHRDLEGENAMIAASQLNFHVHADPQDPNVRHRHDR